MQRILQFASIALIALGMWLLATSFIEPPSPDNQPRPAQALGKPAAPPVSQAGLGIAVMAGGVLALIIFSRR